MQTNPKIKWQDAVKGAADLHLDLQNPRLPKRIREQKDVGAVREYLLEHEDVLEIAKSIAANGYHKSAVSIAHSENGQLLVLDGNRRLAACQFLLNPSLARNDSDKRRLEKLAEGLDKSELANLKVTIAPSRKDAEREIWDIHVNRLLKSWEQLQRLRMYRNAIDDGVFDIESAAKQYGTTKGNFAEELAKLHFYEWILSLGGDLAEEQMRDAGFNAVERLILSSNGKRLLKYVVSANGIVTFDDEDDAKRKLKKLIPYIIGDKRVPAQADQAWLEENVFSKIDPKEFAKNIPKRKKTRKVKRRKPNEKSFPKLTLKRRRNSVKYPLDQAVEVVEHVLVHMDAVAEQLLRRHDNRETLTITDEYDVQDLVHALLALFFEDVSDEEENISGGGAASRMDFLLLDNGTIIEVKTTLTRKGSDVRKKLQAELNDDVIKYSQYPNCKRIYLFVYDPEKKIRSPGTFERALSKVRLENIEVKAIINRG